MHALDMTLGNAMQSLGCATYHCKLSSPSAIAAFAKTSGSRALDLAPNIAGTGLPHV